MTTARTDALVELLTSPPAHRPEAAAVSASPAMDAPAPKVRKTRVAKPKAPKHKKDVSADATPDASAVHSDELVFWSSTLTLLCAIEPEMRGTARQVVPLARKALTRAESHFRRASKAKNTLDWDSLSSISSAIQRLNDSLRSAEALTTSDAPAADQSTAST